MRDDLLTPACRMAFAALIHDIGKFAERAKIEIPLDVKERNQQVYCPKDKYSYFTHIHAAYTGIAVDRIEKYLLPINNTDTFPFQTDEFDNSIISAAAAHHKPESYLQHIITTADRLSSAFERNQYDEYNKRQNENYQSARMVSVFEELKLDEKSLLTKDFKFQYPLKALSAESIFPVRKEAPSRAKATQEYRELWEAFVEDVQKLKKVGSWDLWLDAFDTLYSIYTVHIPSASYKTIPDVSLYDHSKSTAALATALWRYHYETQTETKESLTKDEINKFMLIQADVSGIQKFIFEAGKNTNKAAYKILRGRSFFVSLIAECAALKILEALQLPSVSQIMNAAGKFIILAPNTAFAKEKLQTAKKELDKWLFDKFCGLLSIGISTVEASQKEFEDKRFKQLQKKIGISMSLAKMQQFDLCRNYAGVRGDFYRQYDNTKGICCFDGIMPAEVEVGKYISSGENSADGGTSFACELCMDILSLGENLTGKSCLSVARAPVKNGFASDIFGYYIGWKPAGDDVRIWDISLLENDKSLFNGYARRYINAYVPRFKPGDAENELYKEIGAAETGKIKTFSHLAVENCLQEDGSRKVKPAIMCLKGDIDNLGSIFQKDIGRPTFATIAQLSRQINDFFAVWLPWFQNGNSAGRNIYTVFAGGDDFYLIGPWLDIVRFVPVLKDKFAEYMCARPDITFSVGMCMSGSGDGVVNMSAMVEEALESAKARKNFAGEVVKNGVCCFGETVSFEDYRELLNEVGTLEQMNREYGLSTGYIYGLISLCEQAQRAKDGSFADAVWRSKLVYRTSRLIDTSAKVPDEQKEQAVRNISKQLGEALENYASNYKIALFTWLYQQRKE